MREALSVRWKPSRGMAEVIGRAGPEGIWTLRRLDRDDLAGLAELMPAERMPERS